MEVNELLVGILTNLVLFVIAVAGGYIVRWLKQHLTQRQIELGLEIAAIAVQAAEQIGYATGQNGPGKFAEAMAYARSLAARYGVKFSDEEWAALIERAVHQLKVLGDELRRDDAAPTDTAE